MILNLLHVVIRLLAFTPESEVGNDLLTVEDLSKTIDGVKVLDNVNFTIE